MADRPGLPMISIDRCSQELASSDRSAVSADERLILR